MRPTDENQSTSMRPNLMSPRRPSSSGEDSILAMLEREPARKRGGVPSVIRLACYGAGAGLALVLTGALVWLAANNEGLRPEVQEMVLADAGQAPQLHPAPAGNGTAPALPETGALVRQVAMAPVSAAPQPRPASAAVIVDQPPAESVPPLRLLKPAPEQAMPEQAAAAVRVPVPAPAAAPPARPVARTTPPPRPAAVAAEARPAARPAAPAAKPRTALAARNAVRPVQPKVQRSGGAARNPDGAVDADVALISAVIVHANGHAPEGSQMTELLCPNDSCQARPARQQ